MHLLSKGTNCKFAPAYGDRNNYDSREVFGTTIHELAHASHWELGYTDIHWLLDKRMTESWAVGVEWKITNDVYIGPFNNGIIYDNKYQTRTIAQAHAGGYTPLVIDLIDDVNQRVDLYGGNAAYPNDQAEGYTLSEIEDALPGSLGSWWTWRDKIKEKYNNPTEEHIDYLFQTYAK